jgi:uncharacterized OB-fold protein
MTDNDTYYEKGLGGGRNTLDAQRFWDAAQDERLVIQRCGDCGEYVFPPQDVCAYCWADDLEWEAVDGDGQVHSFSTVHVDIHSTWGDRVPYTVAAVELDRGPFVVTTLVDCGPDTVEIGMDGEVTFGELPDEDGLFPQFRPSD